jgi:Peptidase family M1 domain
MATPLRPILALALTGWTFALAAPASAQQWLNADPNPKTNQSTFRAVEEFPDPNDYRTASGSPGPRYWEQRVDYAIKASLDTVSHTVTGSERVTYHNNSPDPLEYLWFQLDQNIDDPAVSRTIRDAAALPRQLSPQARRFLAPEPFEGGHKITRVQLVSARAGKVQRTDIDYVINGTVMKLPLPAPLLSGQRAVVEIDWHFIVPETSRNGRGVREQVKDGWLYEVAQWFPRASVYDDVNGWQTDQFYGTGEFYLNFGSYDVELTVPHDHIVAATGVLLNPVQVLTPTQRRRLAQALTSETPKFILTGDEVMTPASRPPGTAPLTWKFHADSVRDFAWVSSKTYAWDAAGFRYRPGGRVIELHSLYPREAMPLWDSLSTRAIAQTMRTYGRMAFEYPYPKATNVHGPVFGMEYPMIAFCGARPAADGSYTPGLARALISVTIHEVGHNWFPMIVASDERKWTWMDEGLNSFLQYYAEKDWDPAYPSQRGPAKNIVPYMKDPDQMPLMTESDFISRRTFGNNGYGKPAAGLVMLREQVLGPRLFDQAFSSYARRWAFKQPQPADFFRSLDDGAGELLTWFWRGWFYSTYANDQAVTEVDAQPADSLIGTTARGKNYVRIKVENRGGLVMPIQMDVTFEDGTTQRVKLGVDVWRGNEQWYTYGFFTDQTVTKVVLDPDEVLADINRDNNVWTQGPAPTS